MKKFALPLPLPAAIEKLKPYTSARSILKGKDWIFMDANESPSPPPLPRGGLPAINRYPDPTADALRDALAASYGIERGNVIAGNGSDELIDLAIRSFVRKGRRVLSLVPTYGMYRVSADANGVSYEALPLALDGTFDTSNLAERAKDADILFLCSPNNPTGTAIDLRVIENMLRSFPGLVVVDEAYGEFADNAGLSSAVSLVRKGRKNLLVLRTFSKAFAAAGIRLGYGIAAPEIIDVFLKVKPPYNVNALTQAIGLQLWKDAARMRRNVQNLIAERDRLMQACNKLGCRVFPSVANFFLINPPTKANSERIYAQLRDRNGIILRRIEWKSMKLLRITTGSRRENNLLLSALSILL